MLLLSVTLLLAQADVQPRTVPYGKVPTVAASPVASRINDAMFFMFETATEGVSEQDFEVVRNDARILVVKVSGESCGAYCETFGRSASFDMRTGRLLTLDDLVTAKGQKRLASMMKAERKRRYVAEAKSNKAALEATPATDKETRDDLESRQALNEGCAQAAETYDVRYSIGKTDVLVMTAGRCSNHAMRALDDVGDVTLEIPAAKLDLTPYGKSILAGGPDAPAPATPFGHVLHGTVGKAQVTMLLEKLGGDGSINGQYFYDKHRKSIDLVGSIDGSEVTLDEDGGKHVLTVRQGGLSGTWSGNGKELPVVLKP